MQQKYLTIANHYEKCLTKYGDSHLGVDWPNKKDAEKRYDVMLGVIGSANISRSVSLLDFGCGASHLYEYISKNNIKNINYCGLDISQSFIDLSKKKYPHIQYYCGDIFDDDFEVPSVDFVILNGVFTEKIDLSHEEMFLFMQKIIKKVYAKTNIGIAFNVMSTCVDWEREDLFHLSFSALCDFLYKEISRNFLLRQDYGLYEYTAYVYRHLFRELI